LNMFKPIFTKYDIKMVNSKYEVPSWVLKQSIDLEKVLEK
jgi:hypothetical protein